MQATPAIKLRKTIDMLAPEQRKEFFDRGFTKIPQVFCRDDADKMVSRFWDFMERHQNVRLNQPNTWTEGQVYGISDLKRSPEFERIGSTMMLSIVDDLLGKGNWRRPTTWGQVLATFPAANRKWSWNSIFQGQVDVQTITWHTDYEYTIHSDMLAGVQVFSILAKLESGGGGTLVVDGSHRVVKNFVRDRSPESLKNMKKTRVALMASDAWLEAILQSPSVARPEDWLATQKTTISGVPVSVTELTGEPGDVYFCHPWLIHAGSPNCNAMPRLMCTQRLRANTSPKRKS